LIRTVRADDDAERSDAEERRMISATAPLTG
jgi:hypothetical protein